MRIIAVSCDAEPDFLPGCCIMGLAMPSRPLVAWELVERKRERERRSNGKHSRASATHEGSEGAAAGVRAGERASESGPRSVFYLAAAAAEQREAAFKARSSGGGRRRKGRTKKASDLQLKDLVGALRRRKRSGGGCRLKESRLRITRSNR